MPRSTIVQATLSDMRYLIDSAKREGWNPGLDDAVPYHFTDPNGFFIELLDNKPIGCISAVAYNDAYGFMGFYIVEPELRHQGYGIKLWDRAIEYLGNRTIGLDGVVAQQDNYRKSNFKFYYNNIRFEGKPKGKTNKELQRLDTIPYKTLLDYDSKVFGLNRDIFLQHWITMPHSYALGKMEGDKLTGYGVIRKCETGCKIGPLFADSYQIAHQIYLGLVDTFNGDSIYLDIVQTNTKALKLAQEQGMTKVFETARMYKGIPPSQKAENIFGITSFELG